MRAFQEYDDHGIPAGFREAQKWFVSNPKTQAPYPAKIIWGIATNAKGSDFKSFEARVGLKKAGFECADLSKSPPNHNGRRYLEEGAVRSSIRSSRERNPVARALCIEHYRKMNNGNLVCTICHFDFAVAYGPLGEGFMHVHHLNPISEAKDTRRVSPEIDLVPVCPNCHAMIHRGGETRSIVEILRILTQS
ncbi:hypothetical protein GS632_19195 [Ruegeria sp. HKCCD7296]|nr:hypothetical protein [Ruegeria sp. HKCCD7296]NOE43860.1 hypothetical protein [Ruegeria sp. HKCCD7319]